MVYHTWSFSSLPNDYVLDFVGVVTFLGRAQRSQNGKFQEHNSFFFALGVYIGCALWYALFWHGRWRDCSAGLCRCRADVLNGLYACAVSILLNVLIKLVVICYILTIESQVSFGHRVNWVLQQAKIYLSKALSKLQYFASTWELNLGQFICELYETQSNHRLLLVLVYFTQPRAWNSVWCVPIIALRKHFREET